MTKEKKALEPSELRVDNNTNLGDLIKAKADIKVLMEDNRNLKNAVVELALIVKKLALKSALNEADINTIQSINKGE